MKCVQEQRYFTRFLGLLSARIKITGNNGFKSYLQQFSYFHTPLILQVCIYETFICMILHTIYLQSDSNFNVNKNKNAPSERISTHCIMQVTGWKVVIRAKCGNAHWTKWRMHQTNEELHIGKSGLMARRHSWRIIWKNWPNKLLRYLKYFPELVF